MNYNLVVPIHKNLKCYRDNLSSYKRQTLVEKAFENGFISEPASDKKHFTVINSKTKMF